MMELNRASQPPAGIESCGPPREQNHSIRTTAQGQASFKWQLSGSGTAWRILFAVLQSCWTDMTGSLLPMPTVVPRDVPAGMLPLLMLEGCSSLSAPCGLPAPASPPTVPVRLGWWANEISDPGPPDSLFVFQLEAISTAAPSGSLRL